MSNWTIRQRIDLESGYLEPRILPTALMMQGDKKAHEWQIAVHENGQAAALTGTVRGYFQREGDSVESYVMVPGTISGNVAKVRLKSECYAKTGTLLCILRLTSPDGTETVTLGMMAARVEKEPSGAAVDPEHVIPDLELLLAKIAACEAATIAANAAATAANTGEQARATAEASRSTAEQDRKTAESGRVTAEGTRATGEGTRSTAEQARASAETARATAESGRATAEGSRAIAEQARATAEAARAQAETDRVANEANRQAQLTAAVNAAQAAKTGAETAKTGAESAATAAAGSATAAATAKTGAEAAKAGADSSATAAAGSATAAATAKDQAVAAKDLADGFAANAYDSYQAAVALVGNVSASTWEEVRNLVRAGWGPQIFPVGTRLEVTHSRYPTIVMDVVAHNNHKKPGDANAHTMTLLMRDCIYGRMMDNTEALYACADGLAAGTYNFTLLAGYDTGYGGGKTYQFILAQPVPAGGVIMFPWPYNVDAATTKISTYATRAATAAIESNVGVTEGTGGTNLGTANGQTLHMNHSHRIRYGSNNWAEGAGRQWLNSAAAANGWWQPQTEFDRPPDYASQPGFLNGMDAEFLAILGAADITTARNTVYETGGTVGGSYVTRDLFFSPSMTELGFGSNNAIAEGSVLAYYAAATDADRIKRDIAAQTTARYWWLRSPYPSDAINVRIVSTAGALSLNIANLGFGLAAACVIY